MIFPTLQGANGPWSVVVTGACGAIDEPACWIIGQGIREGHTFAKNSSQDQSRAHHSRIPLTIRAQSGLGLRPALIWKTVKFGLKTVEMATDIFGLQFLP